MRCLVYCTYVIMVHGVTGMSPKQHVRRAFTTATDVLVSLPWPMSPKAQQLLS